MPKKRAGIATFTVLNKIVLPEAHLSKLFFILFKDSFIRIMMIKKYINVAYSEFSSVIFILNYIKIVINETFLFRTFLRDFIIIKFQYL